ncbi:AMP-binding protein [Pseudogemmobacter sonorensis]|uniref:AMP-binding protein n=1 Tax=Pseudogemmobacter sonorensis TaxID=2989681 RepID=UPI00369D03DB
MAEPRFRWHPEARAFGPEGAEVHPLGEALQPQPLPAPEPAPLALCHALALGRGFRIGGTGAAPARGFETLTSGSTGRPRRIARGVESWTAGFAVNAGLFGLGPGRRVAVLGGLVHSLSLYGALEAMHLGAETHLLGGLRPDRQGRALAARRVDVVYATPAQLRGLDHPLPDLRLVLVGGSKLDPGLRAHLARLAPGAALREFYGAAETSFVTLADAATPAESVGRPYPGVEIEIRAGEVWVKSPYLFDGYALDPGEAPPLSGQARRAGDWLSVGEMGRIEGGCLYLSGRKGRMVTVADRNVFPEEIEAFLETLPGLARAAVLAEPDARRGQRLYAVVMGDPGQEGAILAALRARLEPLVAPRRLVWRRDWPETASGKSDLAALAKGA